VRLTPGIFLSGLQHAREVSEPANRPGPFKPVRVSARRGNPPATHTGAVTSGAKGDARDGQDYRWRHPRTYEGAFALRQPPSDVEREPPIYTEEDLVNDCGLWSRSHLVHGEPK